MTLYDLLVSISLDTSAYDKGMDASSKKAHSFGESVKSGFGKLAKLGTKAVAGASAAVTAFAGASIKTGMDFDKSMSQVAATMGKTTKEMEQEVGEVDLAWGHFSGNLREYAQEMGKNTAFSASQAADALNYMALAGYDTQKSMEMLPNVLNLAAAGGMELATASDMITDASSALGLTQEQTNKMVDQMAAASSKSNTSVEQLGQAMLTVGGTAKSLKGGTTELSTALGILADNGVKGAEGGTALRNVLTTIQGSKFEKTFGEMGISAYDAQGNLRSLKDVFMDMNTAMDGMTTEEKTNLINNTFNARDLKNVNALLGTTGQKWDELSAAIDNSAGAAQKMADTQLDNLAGDITLFRSALEGAQIALSDKLSPGLRDFVKEGSSGISKFTDLLSSGDFAGAIESAGGTLAKLASMALSKVPELVSAGMQLLKGLGNGFAKEAPGLIQNLTVMAISGLRSVADAIISNAPIIAEKVPELLQSFIARFETISSSLLSIGIDMLNQLGAGMVQGIPTLLESVLPMILQFTEYLRSNAGKFIDAGLNFITNLAQGIINSIPVLVSYVPQIITNLAGIINDNAPKIISTGINIIKNLGQGIIDALPTIIANFGNIVTAIFSVIQAVNWIQLGSNIITMIGNGIRALSTALPNLLKNIGRSAANFFKNINWANVGSSVLRLLGNGIQSVGKSLPNILKTIGKTALNLFKGINWLGVGSAVVKFIVNGVKTIGKNIGTTLVNLGKSALNAFKNINWVSLGRNIITGIISGIGGAAGALFSKLKGLASNALSSAKKALGIKSPSKVFEKEVGKNIMLGWAKGIENNAPLVEGALSDVNNGMYDAFASLGEIPIAQDVSVSASPLDMNADSPIGAKIINFSPQITVNGAEDPEDWASRFVRQLRQEVRMA